MRTLPIDDQKEIILNTIEENPVVIITAETGAGKSTRIPQWFWEEGKKVLVTQPRRIAARSLSYYLAQINSLPWGTQIGYQTGFDRKFSSQTNLLYLTDGVQMLKEIKGQDDYDMLILDEVHEWNLNQEVLVGLVKKKLNTGQLSKSGKKIVIMSATLHTQKLSVFLNQAPVISVPGRGFPVTMFHNHPDFLLSDTVQMIEMDKNILVFQPGKNEIEEFIKLLNTTLDQDKLKAKILPLHSELSIKEQARVFNHFPVPKVVVATDIAQTSLTIDDIDAVIDTGIKKEIRVAKGIEGLYPVDISNSECLQRAGRAGRVKNGQYILCADLSIKDRPAFPEPEIRRLNLESVILRLIKWGLSPLEFPYFHSPRKNLIHKAIKNLKTFGAVTDDEKITPDGTKMAEIPVTIRSSRLLLEAKKSSAQVFDNALKLIAILETKGIVNKEFQGVKYYSAALNSDLINQLFIWNNAKLNRKIISYKKLSLAKDIYRELKNRMGMTNNIPVYTPKKLNVLARSIISAFVDHAYTKSGNFYIRENEERQLDRTSILLSSLPDAIVGMPFDLFIEWVNKNTGEKEKKCLSLISFATEISPKLLADLEPFSYRKEQEIKIEKNLLTVKNTIYFGGNIVFEYNSPPDWNNQTQKKDLIYSIKIWYKKNHQSLKFYSQLEQIRRYFQDVKKILSASQIKIIKRLKTFDFYWENYLFQELKRHLKNGDLLLFFNVHSGFQNINLKKILPDVFIHTLKKMNWPKKIPILDKELPLIYSKNKPYVKLDFTQFEKVKKEQLTLPTGEQVGIILGNRKHHLWDMAVYRFNRWKKLNVFEKKWKNTQKQVKAEDILEIPFPVSFSSGQSKENTPFEFYSAPCIKGEKISLIHFLEKDQAQAYFDKIKPEWEVFLKKHKQQKIKSIFKEKGWKVK